MVHPALLNIVAGAEQQNKIHQDILQYVFTLLMIMNIGAYVTENFRAVMLYQLCKAALITFEVKRNTPGIA